jgi:WD40 repeat protein
VLTKIKEVSGHVGAIYSCTQSNGFLFTGGADKIVAKWNLETGIQDNFSIKLSNSTYSIKIIKDDVLAIGLSNGDLHLIDIALKKELKFYKQHKSAIFSIQTNLVKKHFYTSDLEGNLAIWDCETFELLSFLPLNCGKIRKITINSMGTLIALACQDESLRVFETQFYNEIYNSKKHKDGATSVIFHPKNEDLLISGGKDALLKVTNWRENKIISDFPAHNFAIYDIVSFADYDMFVTVSRDKSIKLWNLENYSFITKVEKKDGGHSHSINALEIIGFNSFVTVGDDKKIINWQIR